MQRLLETFYQAQRPSGLFDSPQPFSRTDLHYRTLIAWGVRETKPWFRKDHFFGYPGSIDFQNLFEGYYEKLRMAILRGEGHDDYPRILLTDQIFHNLIDPES